MPKTLIDRDDIAQVQSGQQLVVQYLNEAHATETGLAATLTAHISMTPTGSYRTILERHLDETRGQAEALQRRLDELGAGGNLLQAGIGLVQSALAQVLALSKGPLDVVRGHGGEEKLLKNAKDECATEALEIATYQAIEELAYAVGDDKTARLAVTHRKQEERMLAALQKELPKLTKATVRAIVMGDVSYDVTETGAADAVREARDTVQAVATEAGETARQAGKTARKSTRTATKRAKKTTRSTAKQARKVPGAAQVEGTARGAVAGEGDLPVAGYDDLSAGQVTSKLTELTQVELETMNAYERRHRNRSTVLERIQTLRGDEPFAGYDDLNQDDVVKRVRDGDEPTVTRVRDYEQKHRRRLGVLSATSRELSSS